MPRSSDGTCFGGVVVRVHRVVDEAGLHGAVARCRLVTHPLVGTPLGTRVDRGLRRRLHRAQRDRVRAVVGLHREVSRGLRLVGAASCSVDGVQLRGVERRGLLDHRAGAGVDDRELEVGRRAAVRGLGAHLHLVDAADHEGVGAGALARGLLLRGAGVRAVLVVVRRGRPPRPTSVLLGPDLDADLVLGVVDAVLPGHPDGGVPAHLLGRGLRDDALGGPRRVGLLLRRSAGCGERASALGEGCALGVEGVLVPACLEMPATLTSRTFGVTGAESTSVLAGRCDFSASASCGSAPGVACWAPRLDAGLVAGRRDDVERLHPCGRDTHRQDGSRHQGLLAQGDVTGTAESHKRHSM